MSSISLYSYYKSSCSWRVRILLNLKKISYQYRVITLAGEGGDQSTPDFKKLNPSAQVPVLHIDGIYIHESVAIAEYLEETRPDPPMYPKDPKLRARVRTIVEMINAGIQPKQNLATLHVLSKVFADDEASIPWAAEWNKRGLQAIEDVLQKWSGKYCIGDQITFADCCLVPQVFSAFRYKVNVEQYPTIWRIFTHLNTLPEVQAAHQDCQPDSPPKK